MSDLEIGMLGMADEPEDAANAASGESAASESHAPVPVALYIHVPFCRSKCAYCDFTSAVSDARWHAPYIDAILFSAAHWASYDLLDDVPTLYFGGGTPTILGDELVRLVRGLRDIITLRADAEITVETNPDTTDAALIEELVQAGVNRFSLGIQSLDDDVLRVLGRRHTAAQALEAATVLAGSGQPFSVDLICGIPGQSDGSWRETVCAALGTGAGHLSVYPLSIEDGTLLCEQVTASTLPEPDSDAAAAMMLTAEEVWVRARRACYRRRRSRLSRMRRAGVEQRPTAALVSPSPLTPPSSSDGRSPRPQTSSSSLPRRPLART